MHKSILAMAIGVMFAVMAPAHAEQMTFTSWGGTTQDAQRAAWGVPFAQKEGVTVLQAGPTNYGKLKAMVESGNVAWDVVDVEGDYAIKAGRQGLLEKLDFDIIDKSKLDPRFITPYSVGSFYYSFVIACNIQAVGGKCPQTWADLFNTEKFPGKRTFYKWSAPGVIEAALLADGVKPEGLYPLDLDRAFKKLNTIKDDIIWWGTGAQSQQYLASGEAAYGSFWNGRAGIVKNSGIDIKISWYNNITAADMLVVPKGTKHRELAMKFIAFATSAKPQAKMAAQAGYAPINVNSAELMPKSARDMLPQMHTEHQIDANMAYWAKHRNEIAKRWYAWQTK